MARLTGSMISALAIALLPAAAGFSVAGEHFGKHNCPPYCHPIYGFTATTWRPWPIFCSAPVGPTLPAEAGAEKEPESVPAPKLEEPKAKDGASESKSPAKKVGLEGIPAEASPRSSRATARQLPVHSPYAPSLPSVDESGAVKPR